MVAATWKSYNGFYCESTFELQPRRHDVGASGLPGQSIWSSGAPLAARVTLEQSFPRLMWSDCVRERVGQDTATIIGRVVAPEPSYIYTYLGLGQHDRLTSGHGLPVSFVDVVESILQLQLFYFRECPPCAIDYPLDIDLDLLNICVRVLSAFALLMSCCEN